MRHSVKKLHKLWAKSYMIQGQGQLWGFSKVRYRGLQKNATRAFTALALANIYLSRQRLLAQVRP